jgi:glutamate 5-kinase
MSSGNIKVDTSTSDDAILYRRVAVKAGTTLLTRSNGRLNIQMMSALVEQLSELSIKEVETLLVSSGSVAAGRHVLGVKQDEREVPLRQVLAAVGQGRLMHAYEQLFDWHHIPVAQALLSRKDIRDRLGYLNIRNTLLSLLTRKVIPIINENDVVSVDELEGEIFGDNDNLSALVANIVDADLLVMLGEIEGLFTADPHEDPKAKLIPVVDKLDGGITAIGGDAWDSKGRGGMTTKLEAAKIATESGIDVVIASGFTENVLVRLAKGERIGTFFPATSTKLESRKRWMLSGVSTKGVIVIDDGACNAILNDRSSLLPSGVQEVSGSFARGDIVSVTNIRGVKMAAGITNYQSTELSTIHGVHSNRIQELLGHHYGDEVIHRNNMVII